MSIVDKVEPYSQNGEFGLWDAVLILSGHVLPGREVEAINCVKSRPNFYDAERLLLFRICDMRIGYARVSTDIAAR